MDSARVEGKVLICYSTSIGNLEYERVRQWTRKVSMEILLTQVPCWSPERDLISGHIEANWCLPRSCTLPGDKEAYLQGHRT